MAANDEPSVQPVEDGGLQDPAAFAAAGGAEGGVNDPADPSGPPDVEPREDDARGEETLRTADEALAAATEDAEGEASDAGGADNLHGRESALAAESADDEAQAGGADNLHGAEDAIAGGADNLGKGAEHLTAPEPPRPPEVMRRKHHVAPALIALERVLEDETFRIRPEGDLSLLATDIARLGQLFPVDLRLVPPDKFQIISGFRRVAALKFLQRDKVLARLHTDLDDDDALLMALAAAIHSVPVQADELSELKERLEKEGRLSAAARDMLEKALTVGDELAPESAEVEIDADELALDVTARLGAINQDLALLADVFASLEEDRRAELLDQLRYSADLVQFLEGKR